MYNSEKVENLQELCAEIRDHYDCDGSGSNGRCPCHGGKSLQVKIWNGFVQLHCWGGCEAAALKPYVDADFNVNCSIAPNENLNIYCEEENLNLDIFAKYIGVTRGHLVDWGISEWEQDDKTVLVVPYHNADGSIAKTRFRHSLRKIEGRQKFTWKKGPGKLIPYGLRKLKEFVAGKAPECPLWLVEGETDTLALWWRQQAALGLPGASNWRCLEADHIKDFPAIYIWQETDSAGGKFAENLIPHIESFGLDIPIKVIVQKEYKDPCEMLKALHKVPDVSAWLVDSEAFAAALELSQKSLTESFVAYCNSEFKFCDSLGGWLSWQENKYNSAKHKLYLHLGSYLDSVNSKCKLLANNNSREACQKFILSQSNTSAQKAIIEGATNHCAVEVDSFDSNPLQLNLRNGWYDLDKMEFHPHDKPMPFLKVAGTHYDKDADCPLWKKCVSDYWEDPEIVEFFKVQCGLILSGETVKQMLYFYGVGNNGKTLILELMASLLGTYAVGLPISALLMQQNGRIPNDLARCRGARLVTTSELTRWARFDESLIKSITGGGATTVRFFKQDWFELRPQFKLWFDGNFKPRITTDAAMWDRFVYLPFERQFPKDNSLLGRLKTELSGILNWCLDGWRQYKEQGVTLPLALEIERNTFREESNLFLEFLNAMFVKEEGARVKRSDSYSVFQIWYAANYPGLALPHKKDFFAEVRNLGIQDAKSHGYDCWCGIRGNTNFLNLVDGKVVAHNAASIFD